MGDTFETLVGQLVAAHYASLAAPASTITQLAYARNERDTARSQLELLRQMSRHEVDALAAQLKSTETRLSRALRKVTQLSCINLATSTAEPRFDEVTELDTLTAENAQLNLRVKEIERQRTIESVAFKSALCDLERENEWLREKMTNAETKWMNAVCNLSTTEKAIALVPLERVDDAKEKPVDDKIEDQQLRDPDMSHIERWRNAVESSPIQPQSQSKKRMRVNEHFKLDVDETQIPSQPILPQLGHSAANPKPKQPILDDFASKNVDDSAKEDAGSPVSVHGSMAAMMPEGEEEALKDENQQPNNERNEPEIESFTIARKSIIPTPRSNQTAKKSRETFKIPSSSKSIQKSSTPNRRVESREKQTPAEPKTFQYQEVVRGKAERRQLHGASCPCCNDFFDAVGDVPPIRELGQPAVAVKNSHLNNVSRHRSKWQVPDTPDGFWDVGFPSTAEMDKRSERRKSGGA
ncbi:DNA repair protein endonuclease SAE2/CtIP C-terminus-domain-containing protein, partial [Chytriomyces cf. hyalinus JEL632]